MGEDKICEQKSRKQGMKEQEQGPLGGKNELRVEELMWRVSLRIIWIGSKSAEGSRSLGN